MVSWWNVKLTEWQAFETASWFNANWKIGTLAKWQVDEKTNWPNVKLMEQLVGNMVSWWNVKLTEWQSYDSASWFNANWKIGYLAKWHVDKMASWWKGKLTKWQVDRMVWRLFWQDFILWQGVGWFKSILRITTNFGSLAKLRCPAVLPTWHFVESPLCQHPVSSSCHFVNLLSKELFVVSSTSSFDQLAISSTCHFINLSFHQLATFTNYHCVNLSFYKFAISNNL